MAKGPKKEEKSENKILGFISGNEFLLLAIIIIFLGALWRIWGLTAFKGFSVEEVSAIHAAKQLVSNHWLPVSGRAPFLAFDYCIAAVGTVFGYNLLIYRLFSAVFGVLASIFFFLFVKSWFNKQVALIATLLLATNTTMLILSSALSPIMLIITLQMLVLYLITIGFRDKNFWFFLLATVFIVLGIFLSPYFVITGVLLFFASVSVAAKNPKIFTVYRWELAGTIALLLATLGGYLFLVKDSFSALLTFINPGSFANFYLNVGSNILSLFTTTQFTSNLSVSAEPILDPFVAVSAVCGIVYAFFHGGKRKHQFVLLWLLLGVIAISLNGIQGILGLAIIVPVIFIISGIMLDYLLTSWVRTFPYNKSARLVMTLIFSLFLFLSIYYNYEKYFFGWQGNNKISSQYSLNLNE